MIELKRILCPVDFSEHSQHAVESAVSLARWYDSEMTVLHVYATAKIGPIVAYGPPVMEPIVLTPEHRRELLARLDEFLQPLSAAEVRMSPEIEEGGAADRILARAAALPADMIVMGTHGRSGFERLLLGSVTEKVLRKVTCPMLTVPPRAVGASAFPAFTRILCAVDFSDSSLRGLRYALNLAQEADARVTVVHVLELLPEENVPEFPIFDLREHRQRLEGAARERLAAAIPDTARQYCLIEERVTVGKAYREILRLAEEQQAELVVMGVRGRGAVDLVVFGSTTQHVVRQAKCPVLTVRTG